MCNVQYRLVCSECNMHCAMCALRVLCKAVCALCSVCNVQREPCAVCAMCDGTPHSAGARLRSLLSLGRVDDQTITIIPPKVHPPLRSATQSQQCVLRREVSVQRKCSVCEERRRQCVMHRQCSVQDIVQCIGKAVCKTMCNAQCTGRAVCAEKRGQG